MPGILTFAIDDTLKAIVHNARNAPTRSPNYDELYDPACRKDSKEPAEGVFPTQDDVDPAKIPHGLWLVKDSGIYLMSPGEPGVRNADDTGNLVAYANEANPGTTADCYQAARAIMGGDDCVEKLELEFFEDAIARGMTTMVVKVGPTSLSLTARR